MMIGAEATAWYELTDAEYERNDPRDWNMVRGMRMPRLTRVQIDCLMQLAQRMRGDGYVNSKQTRSELVSMGLAERYQGFNFITKSGVAVLDVLGLLKESGEVKEYK